MAREIKSTLTLDAAGFRREAAKAGASLDGIAQTAATKLAGIGSALLAGFSVGSSIAFLKRVGDELDSIGKAARRTEIDTTSWQLLEEAFRRGDSSGQELEMTLKRLKQQLGQELATGGKSGIFARLRLDFRALAALSPDQLLHKVAAAVNRLPDTYQRSLMAQEMFGRAGEKVLDVLINDFDRLKAAMEEKGQLFSDKSIDDAMRYNDSIEELERSLKNLIVTWGLVEKAADGAENINATYSMPGMTDKLGDKTIDATGRYTDPYYNYSMSVWDTLTGGLFSKLEPYLAHGASIRRNVSADDLEELGRRRAERVERKNAELLEKPAPAAPPAAPPVDPKAEAAVREAVGAVYYETRKLAGLTDREEAGRIVLNLQKQLNLELDQEQKKRILLAVQAKRSAEAAKEAAAAQQRLAESLDGKYASMRSTLLETLGRGEEAAVDRALREARERKGSELTDREKSQVSELGKLEYALANLSRDAAAAAAEPDMSELVRLNGGAASPDAALETVNQDILSQSKRAVELLESLEKYVHNFGTIGG